MWMNLCDHLAWGVDEQSVFCKLFFFPILLALRVHVCMRACAACILCHSVLNGHKCQACGIKTDEPKFKPTAVRACPSSP